MKYQLALLEMERMEKVYKAFSETKNALVAIASLEQATDEMEKNKKELLVERDKVASDLKKKKEDLKALEQKYEDMEEDLLGKFTIQELSREAEIDTIIRTREAVWEEKYIVLSQEYEEKKSIITALDVFIEQKTKEADQLDLRLAETKKTIASMLGGS